MVAVLAAAVSSASAATVGVVFTRIVEPRHVEATATAGAAAPGASVKSAVVLNASEGFFEPFSSSAAESDATGCPNTGDSQRCSAGAGARSTEVRLNILGSSPAIPPIWLGGDSEDQYSTGGDQLMPPVLLSPLSMEIAVGLAHRHTRLNNISTDPQSGDRKGDQSGFKTQTYSSTNSGSTLLSGSSLGVQGIEVGHGGARGMTNESMADLLLFVDGQQNSNTADGGLGSGSTTGDSSTTSNLVEAAQWTTSFSVNTTGGPATPEPSTWAMMITGAAALCLLKRRRIIAAIKSAWT
jgi:hypothetical protein